MSREGFYVAAFLFLIVFFSNRSETAGQTNAAVPDAYNFSDYAQATSFGGGGGVEGSIMLGKVTDSSIAVNVIFDRSDAVTTVDEIYVEYGTTAGDYIGQTTADTNVDMSNQTPYEVDITGLSADTRYYYRVVPTINSNVLFSPEYTFITQRSPGAAFAFDVIADSHLIKQKLHCVPSRYLQAVNNVTGGTPDFVLDLGDTFRVSKYNNDESSYTQEMVHEIFVDQRRFMGHYSHSAPTMYAVGNHEWQDNQHFTYGVAYFSKNSQKLYIPTPVPDSFYTGNAITNDNLIGDKLLENYYAWEWGDALFIAVDPGWYSVLGWDSKGWDCSLGYDQFMWLKNTLESSTATYKIIFLHHMIGTTRGNTRVAIGGDTEWNCRNNTTFNDKRPGWGGECVQEILEANGVDLLIQGHDHLYARGSYNGVTLLSCPMPGAQPPWGGGADAENWDGIDDMVLGNSGHVRVEVDPTVGITFTYYYASFGIGNMDSYTGYTETAEIRSDSGYPGGTYVNLQVADDYTIYKPITGAIINIGDINRDGRVDLKDVIVSLQIVTQTTPNGSVFTDADVNGDSRVGMEETIYGLHKVANQ
ncbi:MAG: metallophosphoesterase [Deltaproteobacteria bacterium]|nr:metallophosphoesterase [Deltaproteobacteria bacterium]